MKRAVAIGSSTLEIVEGDITLQDVDAIVNAANEKLAGGGGVDEAIHRAGGPAIMDACRRIGGCPTGQAVMTTAGQLKAANVIHAVGPVYRDGRLGEPKLLASAYESAFKVAWEAGLHRLATPSLSTGAYGYPLDDAARIAVGAAMDFLGTHPDMDLIRFVLFGPQAFGAFKRQLEEQAPTQLLPAG